MRISVIKNSRNNRGELGKSLNDYRGGGGGVVGNSLQYDIIEVYGTMFVTVPFC